MFLCSLSFLSSGYSCFVLKCHFLGLSLSCFVYNLGDDGVELFVCLLWMDLLWWHFSCEFFVIPDT